MSSWGSPSRNSNGNGNNSSSNSRFSSSRTHPYSRPSSTNGDIPTSSSSHQLSTTTRPNGLTHHSSHLLRRSVTPSGSGSSLPRSGSAPSLGLIGGLKSIITKPFSWIATPSRAGKRDHSPDAEDPVSPSTDAPAKRARRRSPSPTYSSASNQYLPTGSRPEVIGRAVEGRMIRPAGTDGHPALPATLSSAGSRTGPRNFSRPLSNSQSMTYLDPPVSSPGPTRSLRRTGGLGRANARLDLAAAARDDDEDQEMESQSQTRGSVTASPSRGQAVRRHDYALGLPSNSPFRAATPTTPIFGGSLSRAQTMRNLGRAESVTSDVSMASASRSQAGTSLFGTPQRSRMSMGPNNIFAPRDSATPLFGRSETPQAGSSDPTALYTPIRKGNLVYAGDKGFVHESELRAEQPANPGANAAEKLLFALENRRNTPLQAARSAALPFSQGGPFPAHLVGASTRQIRKEINVPIPTARARETTRGMRERDLLEERARGPSVLLSPYGRRRAADEGLKAARLADEAAKREKQASEGASSYRPSAERELEAPRTTRRTRSVSSKLSDFDMDQESVTMTPRRSARLKRGEKETTQETTPKAKRTTDKGKASATPKKSSRPAATSPTENRRSARKRSASREVSPGPSAPVAAAPSVPTITETAPSPQQLSKHPSAASDDGQRNLGSRGGSVIRPAKEPRRAHQNFGWRPQPKANEPGSGRFSALEDDLPDLEDLQESSNKIPLDVFASVDFSSMAPIGATSAFEATSKAPEPAAAPTAPATNAPAESTPAAEAGSLLGRLGPQPAAGGLGVPRKGHLAKFESHKPRATSPLAGTPINAAPESPPQQLPPPTTQNAPQPAAPEGGFFSLTPAGSGSTTPTGKPPATSLFSGLNSNGASNPPSLFGNLEQPKKAAGAELGLGKPSSAPAAEKKDEGSVPNFFAGVKPPSGPAAPIDFGFASVKAPAPYTAPTPPPRIGNGEPAIPAVFNMDESKMRSESTNPPASSAGSLFSSQPTAPASNPTAKSPFNFGAKPAEPAKAEAPKQTFSFGADKPAEAPKPLFGGFGQNTTSSTPASTEKKDDGPKFSFGAPATNTAGKPEEPKNSFGGTFGKPAETTAAGGATPFGGFTFGAATPAKESTPASSGGLFGGASAGAPKSTTPAATTTPAFTFGAPATSGTAAPTAGGMFGAASGGDTLFNANNKRTAGDSGAEPASKLSSLPGSPSTTPSNPFNFGSATTGATNGASTNTGFGSSTGGGFSFNAPKPAAPPVAQPSNPFGAAATTNTTSTFNFGATTNSAAPASTPGTPTTPGGGGFNFNFGASAAPATPAANSQSTFTFGAPASNTPATNGFPPANNASAGFGSAQNGFGQNNTSNGFGSTPSSGFGGGFGAATNNANTGSGFTFGQSPAPAAPGFGSPAPAQQNGVFAFGAQPPANGQGGMQQPPASPGGFSMGAGGAVPGSPSGRVIKPLRSKRAR